MAMFFHSLVFVAATFSSLYCHDDDFGGESFPYNPFLELPEAPKSAYFCETFSSQDGFISSWVISEAKKELIHEDIAKYDGEWRVEEPLEKVSMGDMGLVLKSKAKHHAISSLLERPFVFDGKTFVVQFEVKLQRGLECGGAYIKLLMESEHLDLKNFHDRTPYVIMFGPDKCGNDMKIHFIFRHKNPITNKFEEKHAIQPTKNLDKIFKDKMTHLYTLIVRPNNSFSISVDLETLVDGNLLHDMKQPVNPPREISDPNATKPLDWEDEEMIPDPNAEKPENWDETFGKEFVPDPKATVPRGWLEDEDEWIPDDRAIKPNDWDEDLDGHWEPPMILNPACEKATGCGEWSPPLIRNPIFKGPWEPPNIRNPSYKGPWSPRKISNPNYFFDPLPYNMSTISAVGIEIWSVSVDILFDDFLVTDSVADAKLWAEKTWKVKHDVEKSRDVSSKLNTIETIVEAASERPWLWVPIILAMVFPTLLFIVCCCGAPPKPQKLTDSPKSEGRRQKVQGFPQPSMNRGHLRSRGRNLLGNEGVSSELNGRFEAFDSEQAGRKRVV